MNFDIIKSIIDQCLHHKEATILTNNIISECGIYIILDDKEVSFDLYDNILRISCGPRQNTFNIDLTDYEVLEYKLLYNKCIKKDIETAQNYLKEFLYDNKKIIDVNELNDDDE